MMVTSCVVARSEPPDSLLSDNRPLSSKIKQVELFRDSKFADRFLKESKKARKFVHANIAEIIAVGQCDVNFYMVTEYLPESLRDKISRQFGLDEFPGDGEEDAVSEEKLEGYRLLHILAELVLALDYAHKAGVVHEDIRPENIRPLP